MIDYPAKENLKYYLSDQKDRSILSFQKDSILLALELLLKRTLASHYEGKSSCKFSNRNVQIYIPAKLLLHGV